MSHTKGPWLSELDTTGQNHKTFIRASKENGFVQICEVNRYIDVKLDGANTALISAAPDLLDVLIHLVENDLIKDKENDHYCEVLEIIKKAKGE
jgi:hypothetical protein